MLNFSIYTIKNIIINKLKLILIIVFSLFISSALAGYLPLLGAGRGGSGGVGSNFLLLVNGSNYLLLVDGTSRLCLSSGC